MIALISFQKMHNDDLGGAIFGLVAWQRDRTYNPVHPGPQIPQSDRRCGRLPRRAIGHTPPPTPAAEPPVNDSPAPAAESPSEKTDSDFKPTAPVVLDAAAPSFVGRAANAGVAFFGKLFLLVGVVLALSYRALPGRVLDSLSANNFHLPDEAREVITAGIPAPLLLGIATMGCALLLFARRRGGGMHMLRGCLGCALGLGAVVGALRPGRKRVGNAALKQRLDHAGLGRDRAAPVGDRSPTGGGVRVAVLAQVQVGRRHHGLRPAQRKPPTPE